jgi:tRNA threonylcarbamoyladenosine biosynthesis protein TsaE
MPNNPSDTQVTELAILRITHGESETRQLATKVAALLDGGDVLLMQGDLGAGKTTFVQGLAEGLGIPVHVTSPTFTLIQEYRGGRLPLFHFDLYRLSGPEEVFELGFFDYLDQAGVVVVEWPERLGALAPKERLDIKFTAVGDDARQITLTARGPQYADLMNALETAK